MLLKDINKYSGIFLAVGRTDLRKSVDGLANIVKQDFQMDPFGNYLFLFCNRARTRLKGLAWDKNGYCMYYKRLDGAGARFCWPNEPEAVRDIKVSLTKVEFDILHLLMQNRGNIVTYEQILSQVWGYEYAETSCEILWTAVRRLRSKLEVAPDCPEYIENERNVGYRLLF